MRNCRVLFCWYNKKKDVPTLKTMRRMKDFHHNEGTDVLKLGCALPNLPKVCLHRATTNYWRELVKTWLVVHLLYLHGKAVVNDTFVRDSTNLCKSIVGIGASQLYPFSMCQSMPTGLYARWELESEPGKLKLRQNKTRIFEKMAMSHFQRVKPQ